jgi:hypothetical protein
MCGLGSAALHDNAPPGQKRKPQRGKNYEAVLPVAIGGRRQSRRPLQKAASAKNSQLPVSETTPVINSPLSGAFSGSLA